MAGTAVSFRDRLPRPPQTTARLGSVSHCSLSQCCSGPRISNISVMGIGYTPSGGTSFPDRQIAWCLRTTQAYGVSSLLDTRTRGNVTFYSREVNGSAQRPITTLAISGFCRTSDSGGSNSEPENNVGNATQGSRLWLVSGRREGMEVLG